MGIIGDISANNADEISVCPYRFDTNDGEFDTVSGRRDFFNIGHQTRIRQTGTVPKCVVPSGANITSGNLTSFKIIIWREISSNSYDIVATSEDILSSLVTGGDDNDTEVTFSTALTGIQEGDFVGYSIEATGAVTDVLRTGNTTNNPDVYRFDGTPSSTGFAWESQTAEAEYAAIQLFMTAPNMKSIGDSITAAHTTHWSFAEAQQTTNIPTQVVKKVSDNYSWTYQNVGVGGGVGQSGSGLNRFDTDIVNQKPRSALIGYGTSDIGNSVPQATYIANITSMLQKCQDDNIIPIVLAIYPRDDMTDGEAATRRQFNVALIPVVASFNGVLVNSDITLGKIRVSTGELDDLQSVYSGDGTHLLEAGNVALAEKVIADINTKQSESSLTTAILQTGTTTAIVSSGTTTAIVITGAAVATGGVDIQGTHAVADLRGIGVDGPRKKKVLTFGLEITGRVPNIQRIQMFGQVQTESGFQVKSRIMADSNVFMNGKVMKESKMELEGPFHSKTEARLSLWPAKLEENMKYLKMKKLINTYRHLLNDISKEE